MENRQKNIIIISIFLIIVACVFVWVFFKGLNSSISKTDNSLENMFNKQMEYLDMVADKNPEPTENISDSWTKAELNKTWHEVKSWNGNGIKNTELFAITGNQWRINWKYKGFDGYGGSFEVYIYKSNGDIEGVCAGVAEVSNDTSYFYNKGKFYLTINSIGDWEIEIEEFK